MGIVESANWLKYKGNYSMYKPPHIRGFTVFLLLGRSRCASCIVATMYGRSLRSLRVTLLLLPITYKAIENRHLKDCIGGYGIDFLLAKQSKIQNRKGFVSYVKHISDILCCEGETFTCIYYIFISSHLFTLRRLSKILVTFPGSFKRRCTRV